MRFPGRGMRHLHREFDFLCHRRAGPTVYNAEPSNIRNIRTMTNQAEIFTELRPVLMKLAGRMLRSEMEAEDMVQETYLRWERATTREVRFQRHFSRPVSPGFSLTI